MLKITSETSPDSVRLIVEGSLTGPLIRELEDAWRAIQPAGVEPLVVDLTGVTFVGDDGKTLLKRMWREGTQLVATGCCIGHLVEEITGSGPAVSSTRFGTE